MYSGLLDTAADGKRTKSLPAVSSLIREPGGAVLNDASHPVQRFHVVLERWTPEETDLGQVRRAQPRFATLSFDRFYHGGFFSADVRAGASSEMNFGKLTR